MHDLLRAVGDLTHRRGARPRRHRAGPGCSSRRPGARSGCASPARSAGWRSRTPAGCATRSASRCRSGCPRRSPSRSAIRSATSSSRYRPHARPVPRRRRSRPGSGSASRSSRRRWRGWPPPAGCVAGRVPHAGRQPAAEWCDAEVLRAIRRRSLAALRARGRAGRRPRRWPGSSRPGRGSVRARCAAPDGLLRVVEQLAGVPLPASALESLVLPSRVVDYSPAMLDELTAAGEVMLDRCRRAARRRRLGRARPGRSGAAGAAGAGARLSGLAAAVLDGLAADQAMFFRALGRTGRGRRRWRPNGRRTGRSRVGAGLGRAADQRHPGSGARAARRWSAPRLRADAACAAGALRPLRRAGGAARRRSPRRGVATGTGRHVRPLVERAGPRPRPDSARAGGRGCAARPLRHR